MRSPSLDRSILTLFAVVLTSTAAAAAEPSPSTADGGSDPPRVWLKATFGTVLGGDPADPAAAAPDGHPLEAWLRREPMMLESDVAFEDLLTVTVTSRQVGDDVPEERLSGGATSFEGPDTVGVNVIRATIETDPQGISEHAWRVLVPDREGGPEALFDVPGPEALLGSSEGQVSGERGHGCYAYMCAEVGLKPPADTLPLLSIPIGEAPVLSLDDGSALVGWSGTLSPLEGTDARPRAAEATFEPEPQAKLALTELAPPVSGEWLLELRADYDRERGWQWFLFRLVSE